MRRPAVLLRAGLESGMSGYRARIGLGASAAWLSLGLWLLANAVHAQPVVTSVMRETPQRSPAATHPPQRLITMLPSLTETVCAVGACDQLVATDRYSDWPDAVKRLPKTGGLDDAQIELIVSLHPDLVILSRSQRIADRLRDLGIPSLALNTQNFADIERNITVIGERLGHAEQAAALRQSIETSVRSVSELELTQRHGAAVSAYFEVDPAPYAAGPSSFIGELLARLGVRNIVTADLGEFPRLNPEYVVRQNPDIIFVGLGEADRLAERPGWNQIRAVRERRLCSFQPAVRNLVIRPGPRVAEGMRAIAECLDRVSP